MAVWIIGYGIVQAFAPQLLRARDKSVAEAVGLARLWVGLLTLVPAGLAAAAVIGAGTGWLTIVMVAGLLLFGVVFAINSSLHSYLILAFAQAARATMDVGFYYMSNAAGRLIGTLLSGVSYQLGGLPLCLGTAAGMAALSWACAGYLARGPG